MVFWVFPIKNSVSDPNLYFQNNFEKRISVKIKKFVGKSKILTKYVSIAFLLITIQKYYKLNWDHKKVIFALLLHYFLMLISHILSESIQENDLKKFKIDDFSQNSKILESIFSQE